MMERIDEFMSFPSGIQADYYKIWARVTDFIFDEDNRYTKHVSENNLYVSRS